MAAAPQCIGVAVAVVAPTVAEAEAALVAHTAAAADQARFVLFGLVIHVVSQVLV